MEKENLKAMREKVNETVGKAQALVQKAREEKRALTKEENEEFDRLDKEAVELKETLRRQGRALDPSSQGSSQREPPQAAR